MPQCLGFRIRLIKLRKSDAPPPALHARRAAWTRPYVVSCSAMALSCAVAGRTGGSRDGDSLADRGCVLQCPAVLIRTPLLLHRIHCPPPPQGQGQFQQGMTPQQQQQQVCLCRTDAFRAYAFVDGRVMCCNRVLPTVVTGSGFWVPGWGAHAEATPCPAPRHPSSWYLEHIPVMHSERTRDLAGAGRLAIVPSSSLSLPSKDG